MPSAADREYAQRRDFGQQVRAIRKGQGLSQEQLAHLADLDRSYMGGIERGERNVSLDNIHRIARALGTTPAAFFPQPESGAGGKGTHSPTCPVRK